MRESNSLVQNQQQDELSSHVLVERSDEHPGRVHRGGGPNDSEGNNRLYIKHSANEKNKR